MKIIIILILLGIITLAENIACTCQRFKEQKDCDRLLQHKKCKWRKGKCQNYNQIEDNQQQQASQQYTQPESVYCQQFQNDLQQCSKTDGCANFKQKCIQFSGCSLFDIDSCKQSSTKCDVYNQQCVEYTHCKYLNYNECGYVDHLDGAAISCKWDNNKCSQKECRDAPSSYFHQCEKYLKKCESSIQQKNYVGCSEIRCQSYKNKSKSECTNIYTFEGRCDKSKLGLYCYGPDDCAGPAVSQGVCEQFGNNCFYNGEVCLTTLQLLSCNQYKENCDKSIGLEGKCKMIEIQREQNSFRYCYSEYCTSKSRFCYQINECVDKKQCYLLNDPQKCIETSNCYYSGFHCISKSTDCSQYEDNTQLCINNEECQYITNYKLRQKCETITKQYYCLKNVQLDYLNCLWKDNKCQAAKNCSDLKDCNLFANCFYIDSIQRCVEQSDCENYDTSYCLFMNQHNCKIQDTKCVTKQCVDYHNKEQCQNKGCQYIDNQCLSKECELYNKKELCTIDLNNIPCIWNESLSPKCQQFPGCQNLNKWSIQECKSYSPHCTYQNDYMGSYCSVVRRCFKQDNTCKSETDEACGERIQNGKAECHIFNYCQDSQGTDFQTCQKWSTSCTSNGENCISVSTQCSEYIQEQSCTINTDHVKCIWEQGCKEQQCTKLKPEDCSTFSLCYVTDCNNQCYKTPESKCIDYFQTCDMYKEKQYCYKSQQNPCFWNDSNNSCTKLYDCYQSKYEKLCDNTKCVWNEQDQFCYELTCNLIDPSKCSQTIIYGYQYTESCNLNQNGLCVVKVPQDDVECYLMSEFLKYEMNYKQCVRCRTPDVRITPLKKKDSN